MKKKFINGMLIGALFLGFTSSMVSCKDYADQDSVTDLQANLANLQTQLDNAKANLQSQLDNLQAEITTCQANCATFRTYVADTYATIVELDALKARLSSNYYTQTEVEDLIKQYIRNIDLSPYQTAAQVQDLIDQALAGYTKDLSDYVTFDALNNTLLSMLTDEQSALNDALDSYIFKILENYEFGLDEEAVKALIAQEIAGFDDRINAAKALAEEAKGLAEHALALAQANEAKINDLTGKVNGLDTAIESLQGTVETLTTSVSTLEGTINSIETRVNALEGNVTVLTDQVANAIATANEAKAAAEANSLLIENLQASYSELSDKVNGLENKIDVLENSIQKNVDDIAALQERVAANEAAADAAHRAMLETISGLVSGIEELQSQIDEILANIGDDSVALNTFLGVMEKMVTSIELNGTYNQFFGYLNLPVDVRSNMLVAFHGNTNDGINFPTDDPDFYALPEAEQWNVITEKDIEMLGGNLNNVKGHIRMGAWLPIVAKDGAAGNAGTIYLTVNPTNRDFSGTQFELINSQNETSPVILENLQKSNKVLDFGWTRGAVEEQSGNGFYEAKATLKLEDIDKVGLNIANHQEIKDLVSDIRHFRDGIDLGNLVQTVYNCVHSVLPAIAVKASWEDETGAKSVVSQYGVGVTSIKPLSFGFAQEYKFDGIPGLGRVEKFIDQLIGKINIEIPEFGDLNLNLDDITIESLTDEQIAKFNINISFEQEIQIEDIVIDLPDYTFTDDDGNTHIVKPNQSEIIVHVDKKTVTFTYENDLSEVIEDIFGNINEPIDAIKEKLEGFLDQVNDYLGQLKKINISDLTGDVKQQVTRVINAINKRVAKYMTPNKYMQPILLVENGGYARVSGAAGQPTRVTGTKVALAPTTYNLEVLSPAYKKFVAVTNVSKGGVSAQDGNAACKSVLDKANAQNRIAEVIDGGFDDFLEFNVEPGYTYEILYTAVDYTGKNVAKKFYMAVNE